MKFNAKSTKETTALFFWSVSLFMFFFASHQLAQQALPRFRAGANLVTVDAYFTNSGTPIMDL